MVINMAKDIEKEKEALLEEKKEQKKLSKDEKAEKKLADKKEKAEKIKAEIVAEVRDIKAQIAEEKDEKKKNKLRKKRDDLIAQRDAIIRSKDGATISMSPMLKKRIKACVAVVVVIALIFGYLQTGLARYGLLSALSVPQKTVTGMVLTDGDNNKHSIKVNTYNYYFAMIYNNLQ
ncbi:MAG: hypothetical protein IKI34_01820, partial [Eubacterium sp.]|nr:hypothetical protein [Eubacterium sp.]